MVESVGVQTSALACLDGQKLHAPNNVLGAMFILAQPDAEMVELASDPILAFACPVMKDLIVIDRSARQSAVMEENVLLPINVNADLDIQEITVRSDLEGTTTLQKDEDVIGGEGSSRVMALDLTTRCPRETCQTRHMSKGLTPYQSIAEYVLLAPSNSVEIMCGSLIKDDCTDHVALDILALALCNSSFFDNRLVGIITDFMDMAWDML
ncbi:hypothetical protein GQR58_024291 [Nymphon striatum]|nr:hypothetical protein GQR58_024291 [Nymphon striatum]